MEIKELPESVMLEWSDPSVPSDRHLSTDVLFFTEYSKMRKRIGGRNAFKPKTNFAPEPLEELRKDPVMQAIEKEGDYVFSSYSMEPETILFLKEAIEMYKPQVVLELGAGLSTLILSSALNAVMNNGSKNARYVTLEQDQEHLDTVLESAEKAGVREFIEPVCMPLARYKVGSEFDLDEKALPCFDLNEKQLFDACGGVRPDMIIVDAPIDERTMAGASFAKVLTGPIFGMCAAPGAALLMDDSYNDPEIFALQQWQESGLTNVVGIKAVGRGLSISIKAN
jgi:hypothetical protein